MDDNYLSRVEHAAPFAEAAADDLRALVAEVRRLRAGIAAHRERCHSMQEVVGGAHTPQDEELWSLVPLDGS